jgi:hypothetical protein
MDINNSFEAMKEILSKTFSILPHELKGVDKLKQRWKRNKKWMLPFFDENGRVEVKVNISDESLTKDDIIVLCEELYDNAIKISKKDRYANVFVGSTVDNIVKVIKKFDPEEILNNRILTTEVYYPGSSKLVPTGTKISKYLSLLPLPDFGYYKKLSDQQEEIAREFINMVFSTLVSSLNASATIVLSINPLDFLLVSAHTTGWKSCHNFAGGGYKTGGLAYMCDKESAVAYAYSNLSTIEGTDIVWPVKKWRQMVFFDSENLCAVHSRQYPYINNIYERNARKLSAKVLSSYGNCEYKWYVIGRSKGVNEETDSNTNITRVRKRSSFSYPDAATSVIRIKNGYIISEIKTGTTVIPCIRCGKPRRDSSGHGYLFCNYCW